MIALFRSELLRARSRRVVAMLAIATSIAVVVGITIAIVTAQEPSPASIERGQRQYEQELQGCLSGNFGTPEDNGYVGTLEEMCADFVRPEFFGPQVAHFADITDILEGSAFIVILLGAVLGATLGGADWSTGSITTLLTWEPRRVRILLLRALAVTIVVVVMTVFAQLVLTAGYAAFTAVRGTFEDAPAGFAGDLAGMVARIAGVATLFGAMGLALATIGRSTVAGLGVLLGYLIIAEGFLSSLMFWLQKVTFGRSAAAAVSDEPLDLIDTSTIPPEIYVLTPGRAWINLLGWAVGLLVVAIVVFRARDVT